MILARLFLNGANRQVHRCIADAQELHRQVLSMFPPAEAPARRSLAVLHRLEISERLGTLQLLVQSLEAPDATKLPPHFLDPAAGADAVSTTSLAPLLDGLAVGQRLRFRLRANPTRKIDTKSAPDGARRNGRRVPVRGDEARLAWLARKLDAAGLRLVAAEEGGPLALQRAEGLSHAHRGKGVATHDAHLFDGYAEAVDVDRIRVAVRDGVGPGKAYGFGLLSLARG
jgi:CRISPR system Cascade subunit CasE